MIKKPYIMHIESFFQFFPCEVSFHESRLIIINCCDIYISGLVILTNYLTKLFVAIAMINHDQGTAVEKIIPANLLYSLVIDHD